MKRYCVSDKNYLKSQKWCSLNDLPINPERHSHESHSVQKVSEGNRPNDRQVQAPYTMKEQEANEVLVVLFANTLSNPLIRKKHTKYNDDQILRHTFCRWNSVWIWRVWWHCRSCTCCFSCIQYRCSKIRIFRPITSDFMGWSRQEILSRLCSRPRNIQELKS